MCSRSYRPFGLPIYVACAPRLHSRSYPRHFTFYVTDPSAPLRVALATLARCQRSGSVAMIVCHTPGGIRIASPGRTLCISLLASLTTLSCSIGFFSKSSVATATLLQREGRRHACRYRFAVAAATATTSIRNSCIVSGFIMFAIALFTAGRKSITIQAAAQ